MSTAASKNMDTLPIPTNPSQVTPEWLKHTLNLKSIPLPTNFHITTNLSEGTGYLSNLIRITYKEDENQVQDQHAIVKLLPTNESMLAVLLSMKMDQVEILTYQQLIPAILNQSPGLKLDRHICKHLYSKFGTAAAVVERANENRYASVLVLEDLSATNYKMLDFFSEFMTRGQIEGVLEFLAKFHAGSKLLEASHAGKLLPEVYGFLQYDPEQAKNSPLCDLLKENLKLVDRLFEERLENIGSLALEPGPKALATAKAGAFVIAQIEKVAPFADELVNNIFEQRNKSMEGGPFTCIIHADLWSNNIMFRTTSDNSTTEQQLKVIDWQLTSYEDSTKDISAFILSSLKPEEFSKGLLDQLVRGYYKCYVEAMKTANADANAHARMREALKIPTEEEYLAHFYSHGIAYAYLWFVFSYEVFLKDLDRFAATIEFLEVELGASELLLEQLKNKEA